MKRTQKIFTVVDIQTFIKKCVIWTQQFDEVVILDSNEYQSPHQSVEKLIACDALTSIQTDQIDQLYEYQSQLRDWCFGFITFDVKDQLYNVKSLNVDNLHFPDMVFFQPKRLIECKENQVIFSYLPMCEEEIDTDFLAIHEIDISETFSHQPITLQARVPFNRYQEKFQKAIDYIYRGDTYELNYCIEFYSDHATIDPHIFYNCLNEKTKSSFAAFLKWRHLYAACASPERYLKKQGEYVITQPIKGTAKRGATESEDKELIEYLQNHPKERAENVMIVDLVRNDLSKIALKNTVKVEELCAIYTFSHVHQMISTVSCQVDLQMHPLEIVFQTFPMGSMTGVPKKRTLEIIDELEDHKRGLYSGTIGYIAPDLSFDFNVVIRTLLYNSHNQYISLSVGSAITFVANAHDEYNECLLKASTIRNILAQND